MSAPERSGAAYVDTSALGRVLLGEPDAGAVIAELSRYEQHVSSALMRVELRRLALREGVLSAADRLLSGVALLPVTPALLAAAETVEPKSVATLDAIHLVTAAELHTSGSLEAVLTYDQRLAEGAAAHGLSVIAPA